MTRCITCGQETLVVQNVDVKLRSGRRLTGVEAEVCTSCGERFYDLDAMEQIDAARQTAK